MAIGSGALQRSGASLVSLLAGVAAVILPALGAVADCRGLAVLVGCAAPIDDGVTAADYARRALGQ